MDYSLQLWSIQDELAKDFDKTLKAVAALGYKGIELFSGCCNDDAATLKTKLDELGLKVVSAHISMERLQNNFREEVEYHKTLGNEYLICPWYGFENRESLDETIKLFNRLTAELKQNGLTFGYHNHNQEFEKFDGKYIMDILLEEVPDMVFEPDVYWLAYSDLDPVEYVKKHASKIELVHLKQLGKSDDKIQSDFADGVIDMFEIVSVATSAKHIILEQETGEIFPSLESAKNNIEFMFNK